MCIHYESGLGFSGPIPRPSLSSEGLWEDPEGQCFLPSRVRNYTERALVLRLNLDSLPVLLGASGGSERGMLAS